MNVISYDIKDDSFYLFTCAELEAREAEFLDESKIDRLLKSQELGEFIRMLKDTVYSEYINEIENSRSFEGVILKEYSNIVNFLKKRLEFSHEPAVELLFFEENLNNLKTILKSIILNEDLEELFIPISYTYRQLKNAAAAGNYENVSQSISNTLQFALGIMEKQKNRRILEFEVEKFYLQEIFSSIKKLKSELILDYFRHAIDILNIKNIYRNKYLEDDLNFSYFLHDNGFIPVKFMMEFKGESLDIFVKKMEQTWYGEIAAKGAHALYSESTFSFFEKGEDLFYINFFEPVKFTVSNIEKIFYFFLRKKMELRNLNIMFTGILYGIDIGKIKNKIEV